MKKIVVLFLASFLFFIFSCNYHYCIYCIDYMENYIFRVDDISEIVRAINSYVRINGDLPHVGNSEMLKLLNNAKIDVSAIRTNKAGEMVDGNNKPVVIWYCRERFAVSSSIESEVCLMYDFGFKSSFCCIDMPESYENKNSTDSSGSDRINKNTHD